MNVAVSDLLRYLCATIGVVLVPVTIYCIFRPMTWDQRLRYIALTLLAVVTVGRQLSGLGKEGNWTMPVLAAGMVAALAGTVMFLRRTTHDARDKE